MTSSGTGRFHRASLVRSAVLWGVRLLSFGSLGWLWFVVADDPNSQAAVLLAVLALAALSGVAWILSRSAHAENRWRAALNVYVQREQAKEDLLQERS